MPPKAQTSTARRGRPAKAAAPGSAAPVAAMALPKKRGRAAKTNAFEAATVEPPKKRGRPAKTQVDEPIAQIDSAIKRGRRSVAAAEEVITETPVTTQKRAGRPSKAATAVVAGAAVPSKRSGRPRKEDVTVVAPATPKRRGRPALDLSRVAGSSRVAKRTSPRSKPAAKAAPKVATAPRINSRLRTAPVNKVKDVDQPVKKARGRPKKIDIKAPAPAPRKAVGRGRKASAPVPAPPPKKVTARPKTAAPRKRRGYTSFEVADKFVAQVKQFITDLQAEDAANAAAAAGEADDEGEEVEVEIELGPEDASADASEGLQVEEEDAAELADEEDADANMRLGLEDGANDAADVASEDDDLDETELPSETAVLAEIAAVEAELDVQDAIQEDVQMTEDAQPALERRASSSSVSVDLHKEITEVTTIPQIDGSNEVDVFHAHVDGHVHERVHAPEPVAPASTGLLFGGI